MNLNYPIGLTCLDSKAEVDAKFNQMVNDEKLARALQDGDDHEDIAQKLGGPKELAEWKALIQRTQCGRCKSHAAIFANEKAIISHTKQMVKEGRVQDVSFNSA